MSVILQKHERAALRIARDLLGPEVAFTHRGKCGALTYKVHTLKVAMRSNTFGVERAVRRWANEIKGA